MGVSCKFISPENKTVHSANQSVNFRFVDMHFITKQNRNHCETFNFENDNLDL